MSSDGKDENKGNNRNDGNDGTSETNGSHASHTSHTSHPSHSFDPDDRLLPPRGDYRTLLSFQKAEVVYDLTFRFAHKFLLKGDRTIDQMIQSARSGKKKHSGRQQSRPDFKRNRAQANQRRPRQPGRIARRLQRLPPRSRFCALGQGFQRSAVRAQARPENPANVRTIPRIR